MGHFAPPEPEFGAEFRETNFGCPNLDPNSWVEVLILFFCQQKSPPPKFTLQKFTSQNSPSKIQRRRDDNKNKISVFEGGALGAERKIVQNAVFREKRHDKHFLKSQILSSKNVVVIT